MPAFAGGGAPGCGLGWRSATCRTGPNTESADATAAASRAAGTERTNTMHADGGAGGAEGSGWREGAAERGELAAAAAGGGAGATRCGDGGGGATCAAGERGDGGVWPRAGGGRCCASGGGVASRVGPPPPPPGDADDGAAPPPPACSCGWCGAAGTNAPSLALTLSRRSERSIARMDAR